MNELGITREVIKNEKTNLLQLEEHFYQLNDVPQPNVFRNLFPVSYTHLTLPTILLV